MVVRNQHYPQMPFSSMTVSFRSRCAMIRSEWLSYCLLVTPIVCLFTFFPREAVLTVSRSFRFPSSKLSSLRQAARRPLRQLHVSRYESSTGRNDANSFACCAPASVTWTLLSICARHAYRASRALFSKFSTKACILLCLPSFLPWRFACFNPRLGYYPMSRLRAGACKQPAQILSLPKSHHQRTRVGRL